MSKLTHRLAALFVSAAVVFTIGSARADFFITASPQEFNTDPATIQYGITNVIEGDVLSVPAEVRNGNIVGTCLGYKLYEYVEGEYVEIAARAGSGTSFTVTAADVGTGRKLEWQWIKHLPYADLPGGYLQLAYIESSGSTKPYIDTGLVASQVCGFELYFSPMTGYDSYGAPISSTQDNLSLGKNGEDSTKKTISHYLRYRGDDKNKTYTMPIASEDIFAYSTFSILDNQVTLNGTFMQEADTTKGVGTDNAHLFLFCNAGKQRFARGRLYGFKAYNAAGETVANLVPARDAKGVACVYDTVRKQAIYCGSKTATFVQGPINADMITFSISGSPLEAGANEGVVYGRTNVVEGDVLSVPASVPARNGKYVCTGYKVFRYDTTEETFVEIPARAGSGTSFTVTADDVGTGRKLVWQWIQEYKYTAHSYVQRNLIAQFDGIDNQGTGVHNPNATTWVDLTGNCEPLSSDALSFKDGNSAYLVNKRMSTVCPKISTTYDAENGRSTVEAVGCMPVFAQGGDGTPRLVMMGNVGSIAWHSANKERLRILYRQSSTARYFMNLESSVDANACQASVEMTRTLCQDGKYGYSFYANGVQRTGATYTGYNDTALPNQDIAIGQDYAGFEYQLKSARFYSDQLTPIEIAYNAAIDQIRFFGADADTTIEELGYRINANGVFEYSLSLDSGVDGQVKVTTNGVALAAASSVELWLPEGTPVEVEYLPNTPNEWRFLSGAPSNAVYPTPTKVTFAMGTEKSVMEAGEYPYSDENIVSIAPFTKTTPYVGRVVYTFTDATVGRAPFFFKKTLTYEESLVVAGGGGGSSWNAGGGGGGVIRNTGAKVFAPGESMIVTVGAGGVGGHVNQHDDRRGENSVLQFGTTALTALGGGAGVCGTSYDQCDGGSGGGANVYHCGVGTVGQGFNGGSYNNAGGGGGGAEGPGGSAVTSGDNQHGGNGGVGRWDSITGEAHCYGSGGGANYNSNGFDVPGEGGADSGGRGGYASSAHGSISGENGVDGLGGGGGAMGVAGGVGGKGGSGTVIVAFSTATGERFAVEPFDAYPIVGAAATPKPVVTIGGTTLAEDADYELYYENNTQNGALAYVVVVGKAGTAYEGQVVRQMFRPAGIHYVKSVATGSGDGSDWANAMNITNAVNGLTNGTYDIWCAAGTYDLSVIPDGLKLPCETAIRGGFAADATDITKKAADGAKTIFDGANVSTRFFDSNFSVGAASFTLRQVIFEDCVFQRSTKMCVRSSSKATPFTFIRCDFLNNKVTGNDNYGTCFSSYNCSSAPVRFKDCRFEGNIFTKDGGTKAQVYAYGVALTMEGCTFVTNGVPYDKQTSGWGEDRNGGADECVWCLGNGTTATIRDCDFRGNFIWCNYGDHMGIVRFEYNVNGTIENCRFVGNSLWGPTYVGKTDMGILTLLPNNNYRQTVKNCTFAFNTVDKASDGCSIIKGDGQDGGFVTIENCIFWQNVGNPNNKNKRDLQLNAANATVRYSLFEDLAQGAYVNIALDGTNMTGDPKFVSTNKIADLMKPGLAAGRVALDPAKIDEILALDVHLLSPEAYSKNDGTRVEKDATAPLSPMIDAGNPEADYSGEPGRNGERLNVGGYGNTAEASETPFAEPALATPTVTYETEYTQPTINIEMGGEGQFNVTVTVWASADGENWIESEGFVMGNGSTAGWLVPSYFPVGGKIYLKTAYSFQGTPVETSYEAIDVDPTKVLPPWAGKGGDPDKVVHVREGATGKCDGTSWTDAFVNMGQAMRALSATKNEMWIAGTVETIAGDRGTTFSFTYPIMIRGGFTGVENAPEQRADKQATAMITGLGVYDGLKLSGSGAKVFENVIFDGGLVRGLYLESGSAAFTNCVFQGNGTDLVKKYLDGRVFFSKNLRPLILSGCTFRNNLVKGPWSSNGNYGHQIRLESCDVYMDGCLFVSNGVPKSVEAVTSTDYEGSSDATPGFMLAFYGNDRVFCVRDTKFVGNTLPCATYNGGSALQIGGFRNRVAFTNCLFKANEVVQLNKLSRNSYGPEQDLLFIQNAGNFDSGNITTEVVNCTFAYNQTVRNVAMGLTVSCSGTTKVKNCIFAGNRMSGGLSRNQLRLDNTATIDHTCFDSTNGMSQATIDKFLAGEGNLLCEPGFYSTTNDLANARVSDAAGSHFDWEHPEKYLNLNVHLVGRAGYIDETTGKKVAGEGKPSPCVDAGDPASPYRRETKPNGRKVNMGFYGNTPYQTQTSGGGVLSVR